MVKRELDINRSHYEKKLYSIQKKNMRSQITAEMSRLDHFKKAQKYMHGYRNGNILHEQQAVQKENYRMANNLASIMKGDDYHS